MNGPPGGSAAPVQEHRGAREASQEASQKLPEPSLELLGFQAKRRPKRIHSLWYEFKPLPPNTKRVTRPSRWGNPAKLNEYYEPAGKIIETNAEACHWFRVHLRNRPDLVAAARRELRGKDLACACPEDEEHCHASILLRIANEEA